MKNDFKKCEAELIPKMRTAGFSLIELMVVIAILGILSALVVPAYDRIIFRVKDAESKTLLAAIYNAEKVFFSEYGKYHTAFEAIGFSPEGNIKYNIGFSVTGDVAGTEVGYNTPMPSPHLRTRTYCDGSLVGLGAGATGNTCKLVLGIDGQAPPKFSTGSYTVTANSFLIGSAIMKPANYASNKSLNFNSPLYAGYSIEAMSLFATRVLLSSLSAHAMPPSVGTLPAVSITQMDDKKVLSYIVQGPCTSRRFLNVDTGTCDLPVDSLPPVDYATQ